MKFRLTSSKLTGSPGGGKWSQVGELSQDTGPGGHLFAVVSTKKGGQEAASALAGGHEILSKFQNLYFESSQNQFTALKNALTKIQTEVQDEEVEVVAAVFSEGELYIGVCGQGHAGIVRNGKYNSILGDMAGATVASGRPNEGDLVVLSTAELYKENLDGKIETAAGSGDPEEFVETFAPQLHASPDQGGKALVAIKLVLSEEQEEVQAKVSPAPAARETIHEPTIEDLIAKEETPFPVAQPQMAPAQNLPVLPGKSLFSRLKSLPKPAIKRRITIRRGEIGVDEEQKRKNAVTVGSILLALLLVSIVFGAIRARQEKAKEVYDSKISEATHNLDEAKALFALSPVSARALFTKSESLIGELKDEYGETDEIINLANLLEDSRKSVLGEHDSNTQEFVNLSLIDGFSASLMSAEPDAVYVYDRSRRRVAEVIIASKKTEVKVGQAQINGADNMAVYSGRIFIQDSGDIYEVGTSREERIKNEWDGDILMSAYAGNLYILDKASSDIWRYPGAGGEFGNRGSWLAPGISINLSKVVSWSIDGNIWILTSSGRIERYNQGIPQDFEQSEVIPEMTSPSMIYTNEELENLYILDPALERVVVFDKSGEYKAQYRSEVIKDAVGIAASEEEGKILVLTPEKLYSIDIN